MIALLLKLIHKLTRKAHLSHISLLIGQPGAGWPGQIRASLATRG